MMNIEFGMSCGVRYVATLLPDAGAGFMLVMQHDGVNIGRVTVPTDTLHGQRAAEAFVNAMLDSTGLAITAARIDVTPGVINVITARVEPIEQQATREML